MLAIRNPLEHVVDRPLLWWHDGGPVVSNAPIEGAIELLSRHELTLLLGAIILVAVLVPVARRGNDPTRPPRGFRNFIEGVCQYLRNEMARPVLKHHTDRFVPYLWSAFFFVLVQNLMGLLPLDAIGAGIGRVSIAGTATGNLLVTGGLALCTLLMVVINGFRLHGAGYLRHFVPGPIWLAPLMAVIELSGLLAKIVALAIRLFANMIAGHILLAVLISLIEMAMQGTGLGGGLAVAVPVVAGSVAVSILEVFIAFLQAFVFTFLTTLFIGMAVAEQGGDEPGRVEAH